MILYTSDSEGITLGVSGATWMECLLALSDEFGEGILPLYEKTHEEIEQVAAAVAESFADELSGTKADIAKAVMRTAQEKKDADATQRQREQVKAALADPDGAIQDPDGGGKQESFDTKTREDSGPTDDAVRPAGSNTDFVCSICGADTPPDYAKLTKLEHGEVRCPDCTP